MRSVFRERPDAAVLRVRVSGWRGKAWVWTPVLVALIVVAIESTNTFSSQNTSGWIRPIFERIFGHVNDTVWAWSHHLARKSGHFGGYGLLCLALLRAWLLTLALRPRATWWRWRSVGLAIAGTAFVASLDEWHQTYIPSRTGTPWDVLLDTVGATFMCGMVWLFLWSRRGHRFAAPTAVAD